VKSLLRNILSLIAITLLTISSGYLILPALRLKLFLGEGILLTIIFSFIALITVLIFFRGQSKDPQSQTMHLLVSLSLKFLLELFLTIFWFIVAKKTTIESVLIFFVLYLTFTLFSIIVVLKTLKNKSL
jgi:hypothetical protein